MSSDTHIKFDGVDGESTHEKHKGEIDVLSWTWGVSNAARVAGGGSGVGKAVPGEFHFTHSYDKASPNLAKYCASGKHFATVAMTARKAGGAQEDFLKISMKEVFVTSVQPGGTSTGDVVENVSMTYREVEFDYKPQDDKGALGGSVKFGWNVDTTKIT